MKLFASLQRSSFILPRSPGRLLGCPRGSSAPKSVRQRCLGHDPWRRTPLQPWLLAALPGGPPLTGRGLLAKGHVDLHTHTHHSRILWIWVDDRQQEWWNRQVDAWCLIDWEMLSRNYSPARWDWWTQLCSSDPHPKAISKSHSFPFLNFLTVSRFQLGLNIATNNGGGLSESRQSAGFSKTISWIFGQSALTFHINKDSNLIVNLDLV